MKKKKFMALALSAALVLSAFSPVFPSNAQDSADVPAVMDENVQETDRQILNFNTDWRYFKGDVSGADGTEFNDQDWGYVNLPHSTIFYDTDNKDAYLGISWYRKTFTLDSSMEGKEILLTFEGAMQAAEIWLNGEKIVTHEGGYIPFVLDLSDKINFGEQNTIAVRLDSRPNTNFAPGKIGPDFQYFGGIYGKSYITVKDPIHITDAVEADQTAGGGVFVTAPSVSKECAEVKVKTQVENLSDQVKNVTLRTELIDEDGESVVASKESTQEIADSGAVDFTETLEVENPRLWSVNNPELYTVRTTVFADGVKKDSVDTTYGIRKVKWTREGLYLNDELIKVSGTNLHAETYMLANALPDSAIYEEIREVKENGFDIIRMAHYPHVQAFYDACDKYGVMVLDCSSGWQYFNNNESFKNSTYEEARINIRNHRNHPCVVVWEVSLNETNYTAEWAEQMNAIAKEEYPTDGDAYAWTAGCNQWDAWDIGLGTPQAAIFRNGPQGAENEKNKNKPIIVAEHGDWNYGGGRSTTRVTREKNNAQNVKGGDEGMLIQAGNIQESQAMVNSKGYVGADLYWQYADYAGFDQGIMTNCGVVDLYRIPKHGAYFYRSQRDPNVDLSELGIESGPMVYIANLWDQDADNKEVRIFSNCDEVALYLDGKLIGTQGHDKTMWGPHGDGSEVDYPQEGAGKYISTEDLKYPPITFDLSAYTAGKGELKAVGIIDGQEKAEYIRRASQAAAAVKLRPETEKALQLDGSDARLVWIDIVDENGTVVTESYDKVDLSVEGPGLIVGPKTIKTKAGQLAVWVRSKRGEGDITLTAQAEGLEPASVQIKTETVTGLPQVPEGGDSDEYERQENEAANIFLGKTATASSENLQGATGEETASKAVDGNTYSKWCASSGNYPQWWQADLGSSYQLDTLTLAFETMGAEYHYKVAVSEEELTDANVEEHVVIDNSAGSADTTIAFEKGTTGRYVRIEFTEPYNGEWAVLREVSGTGESKNVALNKTVRASSVNRGSHGLEKAEYAVDGNMNTQWCAAGGEGTKDHWWQVDLGSTYHISDVNIAFEFENGGYQFVLQGSVDGEHFRDIADFRDGNGCGQTVNIETDEIVQYLRVYDITTKNMASIWPVIKEFETYGEKVDYKPASVSREKTASASSSKEGSTPSYGNNGVPNYYWFPATTDEEWWMVDTGGIYQLDNIQMTWDSEGVHKYVLEGSLDGKTWTKLADRNEGVQGVRPYEMVTGTARFIRITLPAGRDMEQGFGLFDVYGVTAAERTVKSITELNPVTIEAGTAWEDMNLPKEVEVVLEDDVKTTLPVAWDKESLTETGEGTYTVKGIVSAIPGVKMEDTEVTLTIKVNTVTGELRTAVLEYLVSIVKDLDTDGVLDSIVSEYKTRLETAQKILADVEGGSISITQKDIDDATWKLLEIVQYFSFKQGNKAELQKVIDMAETIELEKYLEIGQDTFTKALSDANEVLDNKDAMQDDVDTAWRALLKAMSELRLKPDKTALENIIKEANAKDVKAYTKESYQVMKDAVAAAEEVYNDEQADETKVTQALANVRLAIEGLVAQASDAGKNDGAGTNADQTGNSNTAVSQTEKGVAGQTKTSVQNKEQQNVKSAKTGDGFNAVPYMVILAIAVVGIVGVVGNKAYKNKNDKKNNSKA